MRLALAVSAFLAALHMKFLSFSGALMLHMFIHMVVVLLDVDGLCSGLAKLLRLGVGYSEED